MMRKCPVCGRELSEDARFCDSCGADISIAEAAAEKEGAVSIIKDSNSKYRWVYELPMLRGFFLLFEVWKVLALSSVIVMLLMIAINVISGGGADSALGSAEMILITLGILFVLSLPSYYIVTKANNGKYTVLFEMDEDGIDHTQIRTEKSKALDLLTVFVGTAAGNRSATAAGILSASGGSLYSKFAAVRRIRAFRKKGLILLNGILVRNQVYVDECDFDFVCNYIVSHCPGAKTTVR